jgi:hypothetical protein
MNMGEEDIVDLLWRDRKALPVSVGKGPLLEQSAIDEDFDSLAVQKIARPGHLTSCTQKFYFHKTSLNQTSIIAYQFFETASITIFTGKEFAYGVKV